MRDRKTILVMTLVIVAAMAGAAFGHGGRTDSCGGHNDRKRGGYHVHNLSKYCACYPNAEGCRQEPVKTPDAQSGTTATEFWGSVDSGKFHYTDCAYARKIKPENQVVFHSLEAARTAGYVPCKVCRPEAPR